MPGPEDYEYVHEDDQAFAPEHLGVEVSQADSNPAYYPPEAKSEDLLTDEEKEEVSKKSAKERGESDVVDGQGNVVMTAEEATKTQTFAVVEQAVEPEGPTDEQRAERAAAANEANVQADQEASEAEKPAEEPKTETKRSVPKAKSTDTGKS